MASTTPLDYRRSCILAVDDEPDVLEVLDLNFGREFRLLTAGGGQAALEILAREPVGVLLTDQRMPDITGLELIRRARGLQPDVVPIVLTGYTDVEALVEAVNLGCIRRFVAKPFDPRELRAVLQQGLEVYHRTQETAARAAENARLVDALTMENRYLKAQAAAGSGFDAIVGESPAIRHAIALARGVVASRAPVLLEGPLGTGKELFARAIHHAGPRAAKLFVPLAGGAFGDGPPASAPPPGRAVAPDAASDPRGPFEIADGGTVFLRDVGETSAAMQSDLLRMLEEGSVRPASGARPVPVDVRLIAATTCDLGEEVRQGRFRADLLRRLAVSPIRLPALAERRDDIRPLAEHLLARIARRLRTRAAGFSAEALAALEAHAWRGNGDELANLIERALLVCPAGRPITVEDLFHRDPVPARGAAGGASRAPA